MYRRELLKGNTGTLLLSLLSEGAKYGYMLVKEIERRSGGYFRVKGGTIYPTLHRMENDQLVESVWDMNNGGQTRRVYQITPKGREALQEMMREWNSFCSALGKIVSSDSPSPPRTS